MTALAGLLRRGLTAGHDVIVIDAEGRAVSRAALRALVGAARRALWHCGDPRGRRIALHGEVTPGLIAALIGGLLDGAVVVPIDAELPALRKAAMIELARVQVAIDFDGGAARFAPGIEIVDATAGWPPGHAAAGDDRAIDGPVIDDDQPCYVFFTSGTTGQPKGVLGRRGGLAHFIAWETAMLEVAPGDRVSVLTRLSFDVVLRDILTPIAGGATACIAPRGLDPGAMLTWLDERAITIAHVVPSLARSHLAAAPRGFRGRALRHALFAGEPLTAGLVRRWREAFPDAAIYNLYGPTETTLAKFCARIGPAAPATLAGGDDVLPCGAPLPGAEAIVVTWRDGVASLAAPGTVGEVAIATPHRSLGYLDPGQTRERFVRLLGRDVYLTGDLGLIAPDGQLHLRGRADDQIKIRGVRVELAGVAAVLESFDGVASAAVICAGAADDRHLIAYVVRTREGRGDGVAFAAALRGYLSERLPPAAIPSRFLALPAMPLTPNGKLDRARLPAAALATPSGEPAATDDERVVAEAFATALGRPGVGALDDFFALGGTSLAATALCAALQQRLGAHLAPADLFTAATPRTLAARARTAAPPAAIPRAPVQRSFALTPQQRRYVRTFCAGGNRSWCNMVAVFALPAHTGRAAVEEALAEIAGRHDSLRLAFSLDGAGAPRQSIDFSWDPAVTEVDLAALAPDAALAELARLRVAEGAQPIAPFGGGPLFRARLIALPGGQRRLLWTVHHLVSDGTSQAILARELDDALAGRRRGEAERLAQPSFVDVAAWAAQRPGLADARAHARALFAAPYHHPYLPVRGAAADPQRCLAIERALPAGVRARIQAAARAQRTTPYAVLLAAVLRVMARRTGASDLAIATPLAGRDHPQIAPLIGDFINLVALRIARIPALSWQALIDATTAQVRAAARHQALQLDELLDDLGVAFDPDRHPLTGISVNFMPQAGPMPPLTGGVVDRGYKLKYDVLFLVRDHTDATAIELQFRAGVLDAGGATALLDELCAAVEGAP